MNTDTSRIGELFKGTFLTEPRLLFKKLSQVRAFVFDWDGVFNNGVKDENGSSSFSEVDAMGTNLLRFNHYLRTGQPPVTVIMSGEQNSDAMVLAKREHFNAVYYKVPQKLKALHHLCSEHNIDAAEVAFVFDDVLDLAMAQWCGLRIMVSRECNPFLLEFAAENNLAEYITFADGGNHAVRETVELLMGLSGMYEETIEQRMQHSDNYQAYLKLRNKPEPVFYTGIDSEKIERVKL